MVEYILLEGICQVQNEIFLGRLHFVDKLGNRSYIDGTTKPKQHNEIRGVAQPG